MKKIIMIWALLVGFNANAGMINIELSKSHVTLGESIEVQLVTSAFDNFDAFGFKLLFDTSVLHFDSATLTSDLSASLTPFGVFHAAQRSNWVEFSFNDFLPVSSGDFLLASFDLVAIGEGSTDISFTDVVFFEPFPSASTLNINSDATATVSVPEPSTFVLFLLAAIVILTTVAKKHSHRQ